MKKLIYVWLWIAICMLISCKHTNIYAHIYAQLQNQIEQIISGKDATIGVAIIVDGVDTISVNGNHPFPMLSVYKFPIAFALGEYERTTTFQIPDSILITRNNLKENTYSPMRDRYSNVDSIKLSIHEILAYSLQESDNNASDVLLNLLPSKGYVTECLQRMGVEGILVSSTEDEMHKDVSLAYKNTSTPIAMSSLLSLFDKEFSDNYSLLIKHLMETCETGKNRLAKPLMKSKICIGHKTGTGFDQPNGRIMAINDVGYIPLPSGHKYSIAVFIENSGYDIDTTESLIAQISEIVFNCMKKIPDLDSKSIIY